MKINLFLLALLFLQFSAIFSQTVEEFETKINNASGLEKVQYQLQLSNKIIDSDPKKASELCKEALKNSSGNATIEGAANALLSDACVSLKAYGDAVSYGLKAAEIYKSTDKNNYAMSESNVAEGYEGLGKTKEAIDHYGMAYDAYIGINKNKNAGYAASSIGMIYNKKNDTKNAVSWYGKAADQFNKAGKNKDEVSALRTIGAIYSNYGDYDKAIPSLEKALKVANQYGLSSEIKDIEKAIETVEKNANSAGNTTAFEEEQKKETAQYISEIKMQNAKSLADIEMMSEEMQLAELKIKAAQDEATLALLQKYAAEDKAKLAQAAAEKAKLKVEQAKAIEEKIMAEKDAETAKAKNLWIALGALGVVAILILVGFLNKKKSNTILSLKNVEISKQKDEITAQTVNIQESIDYATRIQKAMLPSSKEFMSLMPGSFVFLRPKDSVSGDFFWYHKNGDQMIVVAADCTGHGVPGAFMSIIFSNLLDKVVIDEKITDPSQILESICAILTSKLMERNLRYENFKDGMDVSVVNVNCKSKKLVFSGARNGIYVVRNENLTEIKGTRRSVGVLNELAKLPFENQSLTIEKDDFIYLFSDGFADQKGGDKGKKFYYQPFKDLIVSLSESNGNQIPEKLNAKYEQWKGNQNQFDDVLVVGVKIT